jgi:hypothetical protein
MSWPRLILPVLTLACLLFVDNAKGQQVCTKDGCTTVNVARPAAFIRTVAAVPTNLVRPLVRTVANPVVRIARRTKCVRQRRVLFPRIRAFMNR